MPCHLLEIVYYGSLDVAHFILDEFFHLQLDPVYAILNQIFVVISANEVLESLVDLFHDLILELAQPFFYVFVDLGLRLGDLSQDISPKLSNLMFKLLVSSSRRFVEDALDKGTQLVTHQTALGCQRSMLIRSSSVLL